MAFQLPKYINSNSSQSFKSMKCMQDGNDDANENMPRGDDIDA